MRSSFGPGGLSSYAHATVVPTLDRELVSAHGLGLNHFEVLTWLRRAGERGLRMSDLASLPVALPGPSINSSERAS